MSSIRYIESSPVDTGARIGRCRRPNGRAGGLLHGMDMSANHITSEPVPGRPAPVSRGPARVIAFAAYRQVVAETERDRILGAEWNRLAILVAEALCWRDPESVEAVGACVARLKRLVLEDWRAV